MRKQWIGTIHGLRCSKYGSILCAGNPWIAQHLRDPWIAQPHMCQAFVQKKKTEGSKVISLEKGKEVVAYLLPAGENKGEQVLGEVVLWISPIRLPMCMQLLDSVRNFTVFTSQENGVELEESGSFPLNTIADATEAFYC